MKTGYIVCWMKEKASSAISKEYKDKYRAYIDGGRAENLKKAMNKYNKLLKKTSTYSANICRIVHSTDY